MAAQTVITHALTPEEVAATMGTFAQRRLAQNDLGELARTFGRLARRASTLRLRAARRAAMHPGPEFCPDVLDGCAHTMIQNDEGVGVACAEWGRGVSLAKASDAQLQPWERELVHNADAGLSLDLGGLPEGWGVALRANNLRALSLVLSVVTG